MTQEKDRKHIPTRVWIGMLIAIVVLVFILVNREETEISFVLARAVAPLWLALALAATGGFLAGLLVGRRRRT